MIPALDKNFSSPNQQLRNEICQITKLFAGKFGAKFLTELKNVPKGLKEELEEQFKEVPKALNVPSIGSAVLTMD